jgi:hypothetical protein
MESQPALFVANPRHWTEQLRSHPAVYRLWQAPCNPGLRYSQLDLYDLGWQVDEPK